MNLFKDNIYRLYRLCLLLSLGLLTACSAEDIMEEPESPAIPSGKTEYYMNLNVTVPQQASTRSYTDNSKEGDSSSETIDGTVAESTLYSAIIYLSVDNQVIAQLPTSYLTGTTGGEYTLTAKVESLDNLLKYAGEELQILVAGNIKEASWSHNLTADPGTDVTKTKDATEATFTIGSIEGRPLGEFGIAGKVMPLVNASDFTFSFDEGADDDETLKNLKGLFNTKINKDYYHIFSESLDLERAVARIEFKDKGGRSTEGTPQDTDDGFVQEPGATTGDNDDADNEEKEEDEDLSKDVATRLLAPYTYQIGQSDWVLRLESMQLFNVNKNSYLFRHAASGTDEGATGESEIFGIEKGAAGYSWISNPDWVYSGADDPEEDPEEGGDADGNSGIEDDGEEGGGEVDAEAAGSYTKSPDFLNGLKTTRTPYEIDGAGAKITIEEFEKNKAESEYQDPDGTGYYPWCYVSENTIPSKALMAETAIGDDGKEVAVLAKYATGIAFDFVLLDKTGEPLTSKTAPEYIPSGVTPAEGTGGGIRLTDPAKGDEYMEITPDTEGYYHLTYYAFIKHNDPTKNTLDPMEYAVVRNNTYQLSINSIGSLPFPEKPESYFLSMEIRVLAWARRDITVSW